jgi:hypothetical protein
MSPERFLKWSIWSPLAIPIVVVLSLNVARALGLRSDATTFGSIMFMSVLVGGLPYMVFAAVLSWFLRNASLRTLRIASLWAPTLFAAFLFIIAAALGLDLSRFGLLEPFVPASYYAAWALGVGYAYVVSVHIVLAVLTTMGVVDGRRSGAPLTRGVAGRQEVTPGDYR